MIESLVINGFKSLLGLAVPTARLNVLVGANAAGKSSLIQALLMLRQSVDTDGCLRLLRLNGALFAGGKATDIFHAAANRNIQLAVKQDGQLFNVRASYDADSPNSREVNIDPSPLATAGALFARRDAGFIYLNAERIGPRVRYPLPIEGGRLEGLLGIQGEYVAHVLTSSAAMRDADIGKYWAKKIRMLCAQAESDPLVEPLKAQASTVLDYVIPGASVNGTRFEELDNAGLHYSQGEVDHIRPTHIGFGLSYALPAIVAPLIVDSHGLVIIENPEAHLHPLGQSRMGRYLALAASDGPQIFIETHSDHVVNGIRRAVRMGWIKSSDVLFHYFEKQDGEESSRHTLIEVADTGALSAWPEGFFDQFENDLSQL